ncbi:hypothetical protein [Psychrobacillus lasiicapitis]|uniref:Uncharacterized protein n=1 Tax=Psychrobacillus lasiicapitis TaxID=1636719 RepID=A0A544TB26_9BACI|nr:hypothetical protein [Psychrobacillus lasiicapitis]TQR14596.1 hypothetical protein FG382_09120 [Psychrobacillus lasiicapitis]GGA30041.1 hypothetical protein GCM10011384_19290 [Psychrobacillus lasiicapitis]
MKKVGMILGLFIAVISVFVFINKLYYPSLPIDHMSAKEAIDKLKESDSKIAEIAVEGDSIWYITSSENKGISIADEYIIQMIGSNGWEFKEKDGAGLFFYKEGKRLIATTQMWTKNYVLVKIPSDFK